MTDLGTLERSREDSRPVEVYTFTLGSEVFRFTSAEDDLTIGGLLFEKTEISRNQVVVGSGQTRRVLGVTVLADNQFASKYVGVVPGQCADFTLDRYQRDEVPAFNTTLRLFSGTVKSVKFTNDVTNAEISIQSIESALSRNLPRVTHMAMCGAFLYDRFCGADPNLFNHIGEVTLVSGNDITVTGAGASGFNFLSGYCRPVGVEDYRLVLAQSGDVLTLRLPFHEDPTSLDLQCFAGCDHLIEGDCALVFDRVADFVGFAFVPNRDVFVDGVQ